MYIYLNKSHSVYYFTPKIVSRLVQKVIVMYTFIEISVGQFLRVVNSKGVGFNQVKQYTILYLCYSPGCHGNMHYIYQLLIS